MGFGWYIKDGPVNALYPDLTSLKRNVHRHCCNTVYSEYHAPIRMQFSKVILPLKFSN